MALTEDLQAKTEWKRYEKVKELFRARDQRYKSLINLLGGMFYSSDLLTTVAVDTAAASEIEQTTGSRLTVNRLGVVVKNYKNLLSQPPEIDVPPRKDRKGVASTEAETHADSLEKLLYATWSANRMEMDLQGIVHYASGLGSAPILLWPDITERIIRYNLLRPWSFYPMTKGTDYRRYKYACVDNLMFGSDIKEEFKTAIGFFNATLNEVLEDDEVYMVVKYFTDLDYSILVGRMAGYTRAVERDRITEEDPLTQSGPQTILRVKNKLGFIPILNVPGNYIPHQTMGEGDIEQSVGMNYYVNEMLQTNADVMAFTGNPILVVTGSSLSTDKIPNHPGAGISLPEPGARIAFLTPPSVAGDYFAQIQAAMQFIDDQTGQPPSLQGRVQPSVESGTAIQALLGGVAATVATKQRIMKVLFEQLNAMTLRAYEVMFPDVKISLQGSIGFFSGDYFAVELEGKDIDGWYANEVIYREGMMDFGSRLVNVLQMRGSGLLSKRTSMRMLGVRSVLEEEAQIRAELMEELALKQSLAAADRGQGDIQRERLGLQRGRVPGAGGQGGLPAPDQIAALMSAAQGNAGPGPGVPIQPGARPVTPPPPGSAPAVDEGAVKRALGRMKYIGKVYLLRIDEAGIHVSVTREADKPKVEEALADLGTPVDVQVVSERPATGIRIRGQR